MLYDLVRQSDVISKLILLSLASMSILCWTLFIVKLRRLTKLLATVAQLRARLEKIVSLEELSHLGVAVHHTIGGRFITTVLATLKATIKPQEAQRHILSTIEKELITMNLDQTLVTTVDQEGAYIGFVKLSAETGTLIGLFGTVYGLIHAFVRISQQQSADIAAVAPGIAEALITTLTGLVVAIPAMVMCHILYARIELLERELIAVADKLEWIVTATFAKKNGEL